MAIVCSSCDHEASADAKAGSACPACGERLIVIDTRDALVGTVLDGRFEVIARLGHGGMGVVYRATQLSIGREVAVKVLDSKIERDVASVKRFFREAKLASTLAHPNTVPIIDFGQSQDGQLFLVMELVRGKTLFEEITKVGPLPLSRVVTIGAQLCEALEVAHELAIVHRDLKLENVMLVDGRRDHVKVLDFGLARSLADPSMHATATGMISGTPRYMPPEVVFEAAPPAPAQDMYAVGVILAELAIGRALWVAPTMEGLFTKKLSIDATLADVPAALHPLVGALLATEPAKRPTAPETRNALHQLETAGSTKSSLLLELDRPVASPVIAHEASVDVAFPDLSNPSVVGLDELDAPRAAAPPVVTPTQAFGPPLAIARPAARPEPHRFEPPPDTSIQRFEVEPEWQRERAKKQTARPVDVVSLPKPPRSYAGVVVALILVALVGGGAYVLYNYKKTRPPPLPGGGISIHITADHLGEISIDGHKVGMPPLTLELAKSSHQILIEGEGLVPQQIVPDHEQTVRLLKSD